MQKRCRILVVEDDPGIRDLLVDLLRDEGYPAIGVENGQRALDLLKGGEAADVLIVDLMMPVMDGVALLQLLRADERLARLPVIVATAGGRAAEAKAMGARAVLAKPVDLGLLLLTLAEACSSCG